MVSAVKEACVLVATVLVNAVIALVLLCLTLKVIAILSAARWTVQYGAEYGTRFRAEKRSTTRRGSPCWRTPGTGSSRSG